MHPARAGRNTGSWSLRVDLMTRSDTGPLWRSGATVPGSEVIESG